jgi:hypothetical protein
MKQNTKPLANPAVVCWEVPKGEAVLVNMDTAASLALNHTGLVIWQLADGRRTIKQIIAAFCERFPDAPSNVAEEVDVLLKELAADGFIGFELKIG